MIRRQAQRSLKSVLFFSIAGVALSIYLLMQFLIPDEPDRSIPLADRLTASYFVDTTRDSGLPVAVFLLLVMVTIWIVLQRTLAPVRRLSEEARRISPNNLDERLPAADAPSEIAPLVEAFNTALDRLEDAWKAQRAFSANAAHELRTPLAALRAQVESLLPASHRQEAALEFDRLSRIITQLLVLSEGEHGPLRKTCPFDLVQVVTTATTECAPAFVTSGRDIGLDPHADFLERRGDAVLVGVAVRNLLDNALKHTPVGSTVTIRVDEDGVISVMDDGPGLTADFAARAFQPFARADAGGSGAGLGLSIAARIAQLHGGRVWLEPTAQGACFKLHIPPSAGA
ncbi:sensor histidine kinase [Brevundimonas intermedia]|uniref:sensor histidine kinase n=1 Tax=Brevundimonas intermedia TaxID=74315 RepID=UPI00320B6AF6